MNSHWAAWSAAAGKTAAFFPLQEMKTDRCSKPSPTFLCSFYVSVLSHFISSSTSFFTVLSFLSPTDLRPSLSLSSPILLLRSLLHLLPWLERLITFLACVLHFTAGSHADLWPPTERSSTWLAVVSYFLSQSLTAELSRCGTPPVMCFVHPFPFSVACSWSGSEGCWSIPAGRATRWTWQGCRIYWQLYICYKRLCCYQLHRGADFFNLFSEKDS